MHNVLTIFRRDLRRIFRNPVAAIVTVGVCILPSLYAWINIAANWDPYKNTSTVAVAIVNEDEGTYNEKLGQINVGDMVVEKLEQNDQLGWQFVGEQEGLEGVASGRYYATIEIPKDFSSDLVSVLSGDLKTPKLKYYVNEKVNAVAPKVTDTGASTVEQQINDNFVSTVAGVLTTKAQDTGAKLGSQTDKLGDTVLADIRDAQSTLDDVSTQLEGAKGTVGKTRDAIRQARDVLASLSSITGSSQRTLRDALGELGGARSDAQSLASRLDSAVSVGTARLDEAATRASTALGGFAGMAEHASATAQSGAKAAHKLSEVNRKAITSLNDAKAQIQASSMLSDQQKQELCSKIDALVSQLQKKADTADSIASQLDGLKFDAQDISDGAQQLEGSIKDATSGISDAKNDVSQNVLPALSSSLDSFALAGGDLQGILDGVSPAVQQASGTLDQLDSTLREAQDVIDQTQDALGGLRGSLGSLATDIEAIRASQNFQLLQNVMDMNSDQVKEFMTSPVELSEQDVFPVANYGSGVAPFYTNLAIWVGGFVLIAIYKLEVDEEEVGPYRAWQGYLGRYLLLLVLGLAQALICCVGDLVMGVQCLHPVAFICAGLVQSFAYVNIIYALSVAFKHIGKALCVVLVILQIPGSSGVYPIEMMPGFFRAINPWLPFTYGINAMRETIAGYWGSCYVQNLLTLLAFVVPALAIGMGARRHLININTLFDKKLAETDLMICEHDGMTRENFKLSTIIKALLSSEDYKHVLLEEAANFEAKYPGMVKRGFALVLVVPLVLLALVFATPAKLPILIVWIVSLVAICAGLIVIEYLHERVWQKTTLAEHSRDEIYELLDRELDEQWEYKLPFRKIAGSLRSRIRGTRDAAGAGPRDAGEKDATGATRPPYPQHSIPDPRPDAQDGAMLDYRAEDYRKHVGEGEPGHHKTDGSDAKGGERR
ncbi:MULTISPECIES: YhgE/Pip domain-containing protein [Atopobiaceae]|uniref:Membrane protein n=1 Tax=Parafannyhessea umbonata TaxID=604330 RepID=A0A1H6JYW7_9ACTN|nr:MULTISPECIES: YhgE/Pip domain-containing protein [Atopobiaceae]SEH68005.1 putative membrane protein [Parafannyhessea umbonata]SJZ87979.1 putative membrane protein [Olsenella sp. KH1P3]